jgi:hypothetical protein
MPRAISDFFTQGPELDALGEAIRKAAWFDAADEVRRRLAAAESSQKRAFYHDFLASLHKAVIRDSRYSKDQALVEEQKSSIRREFEAARREDPNNAAITMKAAEYYLRYEGDADVAENFLRPFDPEDYAIKLGQDDLVWQEHRRIALRAAARGLKHDPEGARDFFLQAYSAKFSAQLDRSYKLPLWILHYRGIRLPAPTVEEILALLTQFKEFNLGNLNRIRDALTAEA